MKAIKNKREKDIIEIQRSLFNIEQSLKTYIMNDRLLEEHSEKIKSFIKCLKNYIDSQDPSTPLLEGEILSTKYFIYKCNDLFALISNIKDEIEAQKTKKNIGSYFDTIANEDTHPMDFLPNEILKAILEYFSTEDLLRAQVVSKRFYGIINQILSAKPFNTLIIEMGSAKNKVTVAVRLVHPHTQFSEMQIQVNGKTNNPLELINKGLDLTTKFFNKEKKQFNMHFFIFAMYSLVFIGIFIYSLTQMFLKKNNHDKELYGGIAMVDLAIWVGAMTMHMLLRKNSNDTTFIPQNPFIRTKVVDQDVTFFINSIKSKIEKAYNQGTKFAFFYPQDIKESSIQNSELKDKKTDDYAP